jgi:hypothetical protein
MSSARRGSRTEAALAWCLSAQPRPQLGRLPWFAFFFDLILRFTVRFDIRLSSVAVRSTLERVEARSAVIRLLSCLVGGERANA